VNQRHSRPAIASRLPAPIIPKTRAMPADNGVRLDDCQRVANSREQPIEPNEYQSIDGIEGELLWSSPSQDDYLLPQRPNLCLKRCPRPEQIDDRPTNKSAKIFHPTTELPDSRSTASRTMFAAGTALAAAHNQLVYVGPLTNKKFSPGKRIVFVDKINEARSRHNPTLT
jgi:hypothetical protein